MMKPVRRTKVLIRFIAPIAMATIAVTTPTTASATHAVTPAMGESVIAQGGVFYKMPNGDLVTRDASLEVPARGEGDVILRSGPIELVAHGFKTTHSRGRAVFYVVFLNPPGAPENTAVVYRGSYLRGGHKAAYWGDVFTKTFESSDALADLRKSPGAEAFVQALETSPTDGSEWRHSGGFWFKTGE